MEIILRVGSNPSTPIQMKQQFLLLYGANLYRSYKTCKFDTTNCFLISIRNFVGNIVDEIEVQAIEKVSEILVWSTLAFGYK